MPLPEPVPDENLAAPPAPTFMLLTLNKRDNSLKMPDKVMTKWHDHVESDFSAVFRKKYEECKQSFPLDIPNPKREADGGEDGSANKKPRTGAGGSSTVSGVGAGTEVKLEDSNFLDVGDLKALHHKANLVSCPKLTIEVCVGQAVFISNHTNETHIVKDGTVLAGFFKGKFWSDQQKKAEQNGKDAGKKDMVTPADIPFKMVDSNTLCQLHSKIVTIGSIIKARRQVAPADASIAYHTLTDQPTQSDPAAFTLKRKDFTVYWKCEDLKQVKSETDEGGLLIPAMHLAGTVGYAKWEKAEICELVWAVKWPSVAAKGLQPIRPMIIMCLALDSEEASSFR